MASEYIKREDAHIAIEKAETGYWGSEGHVIWADDAHRKINEVPSADVAPVQKWIPVSERLPDENRKCLVYKKHTRLSALVSFTNDLESIDEYDFQGQKRCGFFYYDSEYGYCESLGVTHWMPMPEPPKDGE